MLHRLTDTRVRHAKPDAKRYKLTDGDGLSLVVETRGAKWWRFDYTIAKTRKTISLGTISSRQSATSCPGQRSAATTRRPRQAA